MTLLQQLQEDMKAAMRAKEADKLMVIRILISDLKVIDMNPAKPTELQVVEAYHKKLRKALEEYERLGKEKEVTALKFEIGVVEHYLPKKLGEAETAALVDSFLAAGTFTEKQAGQATGAFMKANPGGTLDPGLASRLIKEKLAGK